MSFRFPYTGILDAFTRADENPLAGGFSGKVDTDNSNIQLVSNKVVPTAGVLCDALWNTSYGPNQEAYVTVSTKPADGNYFGIWLRVTNGGTATPSGYALIVVTSAGQDVWLIYRVDAGVETLLWTMVQAYSAGATIGIRATDAFLQAYLNGVAVGEGKSDNTYLAAGKLGLVGNDTTQRLDDFGGGVLELVDLGVRGTAAGAKLVATGSFTPVLGDVIVLFTHAEETAAAESPVDPVFSGTSGITIQVIRQAYNIADPVGTTRRCNSGAIVLVTGVSGSGTIQASFAAMTNNLATIAIECLLAPGADELVPVPSGQQSVSGSSQGTAANSGTTLDLVAAPKSTSETLLFFHAPQSATTLGFGSGLSTLVSQKTAGNGVYIIGKKAAPAQQAAQGTMSPNRGDWGGITWEIAYTKTVTVTPITPWQPLQEWREGGGQGGPQSLALTVQRGEFG